MIILPKNILKRKKQKFNDKYDDGDSFSIHNLMKPNTPTTIQPPKMMNNAYRENLLTLQLTQIGLERLKKSYTMMQTNH